ncbi:MAG: pantetheine-phosphate adenylyltransferase [Alphaproteobacteria bacterium]
MSETIGIYPGTFDPVTYGHLDIVRRAISVVDRLIVGVAVNEIKKPLFSLEERLRLTQAEVRLIAEETGKTIEVKPLDNLLVKFARQHNSHIIFRGLRAVSDFEYEFKMCVMNRRLAPEIETVFLMASERHQFVSSIFVKEICRLGGDISTFVSEDVAKELMNRYEELGEINE